MSPETRTVPPPPDASTAGPALGPLFSQLARDSSDLIRQEIALAKSELRQSARQTANGAVKLGIAAALAAVGGLVLTTFVILLLGQLLANYWVAALIVGVVLTLTGALLAVAGMQRLKGVEMAPQETLETLKEDRAWAQAEMQDLKRELKR